MKGRKTSLERVNVERDDVRSILNAKNDKNGSSVHLCAHQ